MTNERIEDFRNIVKPFVSRQLLKINNDGLGIQDKEEFEKDFDEILDLAIESLKNERPQGEWKDITPNHYFTCGGEPLVVCPFCGDQESKHVQGIENHMWNFCPNCGADMREVEE